LDKYCKFLPKSHRRRHTFSRRRRDRCRRRFSLPETGTSDRLIQRGYRIPIPRAESIIGFIALPLAGVLLAKLVTDAFTDRYVLAAVVGLSILFAQAMHKMLRGEFRVAAMVAPFLLAWFGFLEMQEVRSAEHVRQGLESSTTLLQSANKEGLPIVAAELHTFIELSHYSPQDIASHLIYLADPSMAEQFLGLGSLDSAMLELVGPWFHIVGREEPDFRRIWAGRVSWAR
jgi:hypothetical protein